MPYFVKYAIIEDGVDHHDLEGLIKSMRRWYRKISQHYGDDKIEKQLSHIKEFEE